MGWKKGFQTALAVSIADGVASFLPASHIMFSTAAYGGFLCIDIKAKQSKGQKRRKGRIPTEWRLPNNSKRR